MMTDAWSDAMNALKKLTYDDMLALGEGVAMNVSTDDYLQNHQNHDAVQRIFADAINSFASEFVSAGKASE